MKRGDMKNLSKKSILHNCSSKEKHIVRHIPNANMSKYTDAEQWNNLLQTFVTIIYRNGAQLFPETVTRYIWESRFRL